MKCKTVNKALSLLLALCMVVGMGPAMTVAADAAPAGSVTTRTIPLDTNKLTDTNGTEITPTTDSEGYTVYDCAAEGWSYRYHPTTKDSVLTLSGVDFDITDTALQWGISTEKIILADGTENRVSTVSSGGTVAAIYAPEITGSGSLTVSATRNSSGSGNAYGIYTTKDLTLDGCSIVVDGVTCDTGSASGIGTTSYPPHPRQGP